jgi:hypothetical protein
MPANTPRGISYPLYTDPISNTQVYFQDMATDIDTLVEQFSDRMDAAAMRPSAKASGLANQALAPLTNVTCIWSAEDFDNAAMINLGVNNTFITLTEQGIYIVGASIGLSNTLGTYGVRATLTFSAGIGGGTQTLRGSSTTLDPSPTQTFINPLSMVYCDGITAVNCTVVMRQNAAGAINIQDRNFWASKVSNVTGGF